MRALLLVLAVGCGGVADPAPMPAVAPPAVEADQPLLLYLDTREVLPLFDPMRPGDLVFLERELFEPTDPNLPTPALSSI